MSTVNVALLRVWSYAYCHRGMQLFAVLLLLGLLMAKCGHDNMKDFMDH